MEDINKSLKEKILEEMTVNYGNALEKNFELAKQFIRITQEGKIDILVKDKLTGKEQILIYFVGKLYAKEAGLAPTEYVTNKEITDELMMPTGSVLPWLKELRDSNKIRAVKEGVHSIHVNVVERALKEVEKKFEKS
jgi:hypothetical protein